MTQPLEQKPPGADDGPEDHREDHVADTSEQSDDGVLGEIESEEPPGPPVVERPRRPRRQRSWLVGCLLALLGALAGGAVAWWWISSDDDPEPPPDAQIIAPEDEAAILPANRLVFSPTPERPQATPEIISAETDVIYAFYDLGRVSPDAPLTATWSYEGESLGDLALSDRRQDEDADHARGRFTIHPNAGGDDVPTEAQSGFAAGIYEVELTSPDYPDVTATGSFVALPRAAAILHGGGDPGGPPVIRSLQTATGVTEEGDPIDPTSTFAPDVDRITAVFTHHDIAPGSMLTVRWHIGEQEISAARTEIIVSAAEGWAEAWLEPGDSDDLPAGNYLVTIHPGDDDEPLASRGFTVE